MCIRDSTIKNPVLDNIDILKGFDVVSLFTRLLSIGDTLDILKGQLVSDLALSTWRDLPVAGIIKIFDLCLKVSLLLVHRRRDYQGAHHYLPLWLTHTWIG